MIIPHIKTKLQGLALLRRNILNFPPFVGKDVWKAFSINLSCHWLSRWPAEKQNGHGEVLWVSHSSAELFCWVELSCLTILPKSTSANGSKVPGSCVDQSLPLEEPGSTNGIIHLQGMRCPLGTNSSFTLSPSLVLSLFFPSCSGLLAVFSTCHLDAELCALSVVWA